MYTRTMLARTRLNWTNTIDDWSNKWRRFSSGYLTSQLKFSFLDNGERICFTTAHTHVYSILLILSVIPHKWSQLPVSFLANPTCPNHFLVFTPHTFIFSLLTQSLYSLFFIWLILSTVFLILSIVLDSLFLLSARSNQFNPFIIQFLDHVRYS